MILRTFLYSDCSAANGQDCGLVHCLVLVSAESENIGAPGVILYRTVGSTRKTTTSRVVVDLTTTDYGTITCP